LESLLGGVSIGFCWKISRHNIQTTARFLLLRLTCTRTASSTNTGECTRLLSELSFWFALALPCLFDCLLVHTRVFRCQVPPLPRVSPTILVMFRSCLCLVQAISRHIEDWIQTRQTMAYLAPQPMLVLWLGVALHLSTFPCCSSTLALSLTLQGGAVSCETMQHRLVVCEMLQLCSVACETLQLCSVACEMTQFSPRGTRFLMGWGLPPVYRPILPSNATANAWGGTFALTTVPDVAVGPDAASGSFPGEVVIPGGTYRMGASLDQPWFVFRTAISPPIPIRGVGRRRCPPPPRLRSLEGLRPLSGTQKNHVCLGNILENGLAGWFPLSQGNA
jgi:hypothetical protein